MHDVSNHLLKYSADHEIDAHFANPNEVAIRLNSNTFSSISGAISVPVARQRNILTVQVNGANLLLSENAFTRLRRKFQFGNAIWQSGGKRSCRPAAFVKTPGEERR
jgi:hypothetical protein